MDRARWRGGDRVSTYEEDAMKHMNRALLLAAFITAPMMAQEDGFQRERNEKTGAEKDALEQKTPPALAVTNWLNSAPIDLESLKGKVVVLDFWGTW